MSVPSGERNAMCLHGLAAIKFQAAADVSIAIRGVDSMSDGDNRRQMLVVDMWSAWCLAEIPRWLTEWSKRARVKAHHNPQLIKATVPWKPLISHHKNIRTDCRWRWVCECRPYTYHRATLSRPTALELPDWSKAQPDLLQKCVHFV